MSNSAGRIEITENTLLKLLVRRGSNSERLVIPLSEGELGYTVDTRRLFVGDGITQGANVVSLFLYFGTGHPYTWAAEAEVGDVAYDSIAGGVYRLASKPYNTQSNWTLFTGPLANRVDQESIVLDQSTGTISVGVVSGTQIDPALAGLGLQFSSPRVLQTTPNQEFDVITTRDNEYINIPQNIQFGQAGGSSIFKLPSYDGPQGAVLTTDSFGNLAFQLPGIGTSYLVLSSNQVPVGSIVQYGSGGAFNKSSSSVPHGYFLCDGSTKDGTIFSALCAAIGLYYGGSGSNFKVPNLTASDYVYIIKYLEDVVTDVTTITVDGVSLTAYNLDSGNFQNTITLPNTGIDFLLGVPDYVSKTYVDTNITSLSASVDASTTALSAAVDATIKAVLPPLTTYTYLDSTRPGRLIYPDMNCGITNIGFRHSLILDAANTLRVCGLGAAFAVGNPIGTGNSDSIVDYFTNLVIPITGTSEIAISALSVGNGVLVLTNEGRLFGGGSNSRGFCGIDSLQTGLTAYEQLNWEYFNSRPVTAVATSYNGDGNQSPDVSVYAINDQGDLFGWGYNASGELGIGNVALTAKPTQLNIANWKQTAVGSLQVTTALTGKKFKKIVVGGQGAASCAFAIDTENRLYAAGDNSDGQLGLGFPSDRCTVFYPVTSIFKSPDPGGDSKMQLVSSGITEAITVDDVYIGGYNTQYMTTYILTGGYVWAAGSNRNGSLGIGFAAGANDSTRFRPVSGYYPLATRFNQLSGVASLAINSIASTVSPGVVAIHDDATLSVWGYNGNYSLGEGTLNNLIVPKRPLAPFRAIKKVQFNTDTQFVLTTAGDIYTVGGANANGVAGNGTNSANTSKIKVLTPPNVTFQDFVTLGTSTTRWVLAIANDRYGRKELYGWGYNDAGTLGANRAITKAWVPLKIQL